MSRVHHLHFPKVPEVVIPTSAVLPGAAGKHVFSPVWLIFTFCTETSRCLGLEKQFIVCLNLSTVWGFQEIAFLCCHDDVSSNVNFKYKNMGFVLGESLARDALCPRAHLAPHIKYLSLKNKNS